MKLRSITLILIASVVLLFAALNWEAFAAPVTLNLIAAQIDAPLGILMLLVLAVLSLIFMLLLAKSEAAALIEIRQQSKELEKARKLADQAEESRFSELRLWLTEELGELKRQLELISRTSPRPGIGGDQSQRWEREV